VTAVVNNVPNSEIDALYGLYESTEGNYWTWYGAEDRWNFSAPNPCVGPWQGVTCSTTASAGFVHVLQLQLRGYNLTGFIPQSVADLTELQILDLSWNNLRGTMPESLAQLGHLRKLHLYENMLIGTISDALGQLRLLTSLRLNNNLLSGRVPSSLGELTSLMNLTLNTNRLTGSIPSSLGNLTELRKLSLYENLLIGSIPGTIKNLLLLEDLALQINSLTGAIPAALGNLLQLRTVLLFANQLSHSIPDSIGNLALLRELQLSNNHLTGIIPRSLPQNLIGLYLDNNRTIPYDLHNCAELSSLSLGNNKLSGTIPEMPKLRYLSIQTNLFTGSITALLSLTLVQLLCNNNHFTGTLPTEQLQVLPFAELDLSYNALHGPISPSWLEAFASIAYLALDNNILTGIIPQNWSATADTLKYLYLQENYLIGPVPESLGHMPLLQNLNLSSNSLTGTIPASFQQLSSLEVLMLQNNQLRGNITEVFKPSLQRNLSTVQLSRNQLTGTLPAAAFMLPRLSSFAAVSNCFDGPLPEEATCSSLSLTALVLDGLHSASSCKRSASLSHEAFRLGRLPPCLLSAPSLETLHLSGSGLTGSIPAVSNISLVLTDLSLSHNLLTGEIPDNILVRDWRKLDLSYNRLNGTLRSARAGPYGNTTELHLQHNRLSGEIPHSMQRVNSLSVLENNMFSCRVDRSDVPEQDPGSGKYTCGSDAVNNALYAWLGAAVAIVAATVGVPVLSEQVTERRHDWLGSLQGVESVKLRNVMQAAGTLVILGMRSAVYCVVVLLPVYAVANSYYPSFTFMYAWTLSGVFLSGKTSFVIMAVFLILLLLCCCAVVHRIDTMRQTSVVPVAEHVPASVQRTVGNMAPVLLSLFVVTGINGAFVFATLSLSGRVLTVIQILLAMLKLGFNNIVAPALRDKLKGSGTGHEITASQQLLVLLNMIAIPCLMVMVISPACFYDALKGTDPVTSSYVYSGDCLFLELITDPATGLQTFACAGAQTVVTTTTYTPPFTYSYQCSSSFVTYYAPTFVIMCIISGFVVPAYKLLLLWLRATLSPASRLYSVVTAATPRILRELPSLQDLAQARSNSLYRPAFDANKLIMSLLTYLALLLTFGSLFPPLAVCCAVAMASVVLTARLEVGRYVSAAVAADRQDCLHEAESACAGIATPEQLLVALRLVLAMSCMFYTLFLFDTLGYEVGFAGAFWVLIVVPLLPLVVWALYTAAGLLSGNSTAAPKTRMTEHGLNPEVGVALANFQEVRAAGAGAEGVKGATKEGELEHSESARANPMHAL
jgi:Leucine-rich repeat (LRR) protein